MDIPISAMLFHCLGKHTNEGPVKTFYQPISLWVVGGRIGLVDSHDLVHSLHQFGQESGASIREEFTWDTMSADDLLHKQACDRGSCLVGHRIGFRPFGQEIHKYNSVLVSSATFRELNNINP